MRFKKLRLRLSALTATLVTLAVSSSAFAASAGMPWESRMNTILQSISGPVARAIGAVAIIGAGLGVAFSEGGSGMRKLLWVVLGLVIAFTAVSFFLGFLGFSGGLLV
jgi:type IV secretion system protein TrbC